MCPVNNVQKSFLIVTTLCVTGGFLGAFYMRILEHQTRQELPLELQTPAAIQAMDGAACLLCSFGEIAFPIVGTGLGIFALLLWGVHELGWRVLEKHGQA